jgi:hypothetical protein
MQSPVKAASVAQRTPNELIHLIHKLRWMGMEDDAKIMEAQLAACGVPPEGNVIGDPRDNAIGGDADIHAHRPNRRA